MNLLSVQKQALAKIMMEIIAADDEVDREEERYLEQIQSSLKISLKDIQSSTEMELTTCLEALNELSEMDKFSVGVILHEMVYADGSAHPEEEKVLKFVCEGANIDLPKTTSY